MPNRAVVFVSEASPHLAAEHLAAIMADAARFNRNAGVSGVTLYDGRRFLAYMEGPPDGLDVSFSRAAGASSHGELIELARGRGGGSAGFRTGRCVASPCRRRSWCSWCGPTGLPYCSGEAIKMAQPPRWRCWWHWSNHSPRLHKQRCACIEWRTGDAIVHFGPSMSSGSSGFGSKSASNRSRRHCSSQWCQISISSINPVAPQAGHVSVVPLGSV